MENMIRSADIPDARAVQEIYAPFVSDNATSFETVVPDIAEIERRISTHGNRYPWLVFERDRTVLGYAYASAHRTRQAYQWCVDVSVYVHPKAQHRGIGRALYTALFELLRQQGYANAYAGITLPNPASIGLHESLGFVPVGVFSRVGFKFDRWHDVAWLHLRLVESQQPPRDPLSTSGMLQQQSVTAMLETCARSIRVD